jgi:glucose/arabinose dehydrogenase
MTGPPRSRAPRAACRPVAAAAALCLSLPGRAGPAEPFSVLVYTRTAGFRHDSIPAGVAAIRRLGRRGRFDVLSTEDPALFGDSSLKQFAAVVFLSTTGDVLDETQEAAFERYIRGGGGFVGIHAAADTEYDWPWYGRLVGAYFAGHPRVQEATAIVADRHHPSTAMLPARWVRSDEWYDYRASPRGEVHVLAVLDERTYERGSMGHDHPIAWCHLFEGGRAWYTGGGHTAESFSEPLFLEHLLGGILWAAGPAAGDAGATVDRHFEKVILDDHVTDPMELAIAPDGRVIFIERGGTVKVWSPLDRRSRVAGFVDVFTGLEDGLLGVALDPGFAGNGWLYLYYSPAGDAPLNRLSRFTLSGDLIEPASEIVMLEVTTQREECCHSGGSIAFDGNGNLYLSTGDNTSPFASEGYSPIDERAGRGPFDAQKSSSNTHDLRGKILRIRPQPDGTYTIPPGNLFPPDGSEGRPEIYAMGCRNPFRISVDRRTGWLYWGEVGPDAWAERPGRGPAGHDEFNRARRPGNFGWPYFVGDNKPYHDHDFHSGSSGPAFDPAAPFNESPNNTGRRELPPATPAWLWYPYSASEEFPELGEGGRCAMAGPVYRRDLLRPGPEALPAYYDGVLFLYDWARDWIAEVRLDEKGEILDIARFLPGLELTRPMDLELGPEGCLYLIEWGTGFGGGNRDAQVSRLEYYPGGERPPRAEAAASVTSGPVPLPVSFSSEGSAPQSGPHQVRLEWDLDGDGTTDSTEAHPTIVYREPGEYPAQLVVTDAGGRSSRATVPIVAGNTRPRVAIEWPPAGAVAGFGERVEFRVVVDDPEDGAIDPNEVTVQPFLGHDTHAHPLRRHVGLHGSFETIRDDGHAPDADLFTVLQVGYTDRGAAAAPRLTGRAELILQPRRKQAEYASSLHGARIEKADDPDGGGQAVVLEGEGAHLSIAPLCIHDVQSATLRVAVGACGGDLELRLDSPSGPLLASASAPSRRTSLQAGAHPIRIEFFERGGSAGLVLRIAGEELQKQIVPGSMLSHGGTARSRQPEDPLADPMQASFDLEGAEPGLEASYYDLRDPAALPNFGALRPVGTEVVERIDFPATGGPFAGSGRADDVGVVFSGWVTVPRSGPYAFFLESDDGSRLYIGHERIVENDGLHAMTERSQDLRWEDLRVDLSDPGSTHELFVVYRPAAGQCGPARLNWIEFHGRGVGEPAPVPPHPHDSPHGD